MMQSLKCGWSVSTLRQPGTGVPVLMLHSSGLGAFQWRRSLRRFRPRPVCAPDLIGYGATDDWLEDGPKNWLQDLAIASELLEELGTADVVGHSYGGHLALHLAREFPDRVRRLALHEPVIWGVVWNDAEPDVRQELQGAVDALSPEAVLPGSRAWVAAFIDFWNGPDSWSSLNAGRQEAWEKIGPIVAAEVNALTLDNRPLSHWSQISAPTVVTCGQQTPRPEARACELLCGALERGQMKWTGGGHMAPLSNSAEVMDAWVEHLT